MPDVLKSLNASIQLHVALALAVFALGLTLTGLIVHQNEKRTEEAVILATQTQGRSIANLVQFQVAQDVQSVDRVAQRWASRQGGTPEFEWRADAQVYARNKSWMRALEWVDEDNIIRWAEPAAENEMVIELDLDGDPLRSEALTRARTFNIPTPSHIGDLLQGGRGFLIIAPISRDDHIQGFIVGVIDLTILMENILSKEAKEDFVYTLGESETSLVTLEHKPAHKGYLPAIHIVRVAGMNWQLTTQPSRDFVTDKTQARQIIIWAIGLVLTFAFIGLILSLNLLQRQSRRLAQTISSLARSEERYDLAVRGMSVGLWDWRIIKNTLELSARGKQILGLDPDFNFEEADAFFQRIHPHERAHCDSVIQAHFTADTPFDIDLRFRHQDGYYVWCRMTGMARCDDQGMPVRLVGSLLDVSTEVEALNAVRRSEERFRAVTETSMDALIVIDSQGLISDVNPATKTLFGYDPHEVLGQNVKMLTPEGIREHHDDYITNYLNTGKAKVIGIGRETRAQHKSGSTFPIDLTISEIFTHGERFFVGTVRDLTERKNAEKERETFIAQLENTITELERFTYAASHDLREPLRMISNFAQILYSQYKESFDPDALKYLKICVDSSHRMQALLDDLIVFSRLDDNSGSFVDLDPKAALQTVLENLSDPIAEKNACLDIQNLPETLATNPVRFIRLFQNLISNAIKYSKDAEPPQIAIWAEPEENGFLFHVRDNGIGMKQEYCEQIFQPFKRLHKLSRYPGTGMGLAICRKIITNLGGKIWVTSEEDEGSHFYIYWPQPNPVDLPKKEEGDAPG